MASLEKIKEVMGWLNRQYRVDDLDINVQDDWGRAFDKCTDIQMDNARSRIEAEYNTSYAPTTAIFLSYAGAVQEQKALGVDMRTVRLAKDEQGRDCAVFGCEPEENKSGEKSELVHASKSKAVSKIMKFMRRLDPTGSEPFNPNGTKLEKVNWLRRRMGKETFVNQADWDAYQDEMKVRNGNG